MACDGTVRSPDPRAEKALSHADFRDMLEQGEYARLDQLLNAIQEEIEARKRSEFDSCRAYGAFDTSDPTIKAELQSWLSTSPDSVPAHIALGVMDSHLGTVIRGDRGAGETHAEQFRQMDELHGRASESFRWALDRNPKLTFVAGELMHLAMLHSGVDVIEHLYKDGLESFPDSSALRLAYANTFVPWWRGESPDVVMHQLKAFLDEVEQNFGGKKDFNWIEGYWDRNLARNLIRAGKNADALMHLDQAILTSDVSWTYLLRAEALSNLKQDDLALNNLRKWRELQGKHSCGDNMAARIYDWLGQSDESIAVYGMLLACDPLNPEYLSQRALLFKRANRIWEALDDAGHALAYGRYSPWVQARLAEIYRNVDPVAAAEAYRQAAELGPFNVHFYTEYVQFMIKQGDCKVMDILPDYLEACEPAKQCFTDGPGMRTHIGTFLNQPCGMEQGPLLPQSLPMPSDKIPLGSGA